MILAAGVSGVGPKTGFRKCSTSPCSYPANLALKCEEERGDHGPTETTEGKGFFIIISKTMDTQLDFPPDTSVSTLGLMDREEVVLKAHSLLPYEP